MTLAITGGAHLHEFTSFGLKAVRGFDPTKLGRHCLRGSFLRHDGERVPKLNQPIAHVLPPSTTAVYLYAKSSHGAADDVHAVLAPEQGASLTLPLTVATPAKHQDIERLAALLALAPWTFAATDARAGNPHYYSKREDWPNESDFTFAVQASRRYGRREKYIRAGETRPAYTHSVFESGSDFVWSFWQDPTRVGWINRRILPAPVEARVVDQTLTVHDARLLDIPALRDGFAGLPDAMTRCPFFQAGVHLFGYVASDALETNLPAFAQKGMVKPKKIR